jgi:hypothetical protein
VLGLGRMKGDYTQNERVEFGGHTADRHPMMALASAYRDVGLNGYEQPQLRCCHKT